MEKPQHNYFVELYRDYLPGGKLKMRGHRGEFHQIQDYLSPSLRAIVQVKAPNAKVAYKLAKSRLMAKAS